MRCASGQMELTSMRRCRSANRPRYRPQSKGPARPFASASRRLSPLSGCQYRAVRHDDVIDSLPAAPARESSADRIGQRMPPTG